MFHTLTNVQDETALLLQQPINNQNGNLRVGLRSITYTIGWFNVGPQETISWRPVAKRKSWGQFPFLPGSIAFHD